VASDPTPIPNNPLAAQPIGGFVADLASSSPTPGGGAVAALMGASAAGLLSMVAEFSIGKPRLAAYERTVEQARQVGKRMGEELLRLADVDAETFATFMAAWTESRDVPPDRRREALATQVRAMADAPRQMVACCETIADAASRLAGRSSRNLASDLTCAAYAVEAAATSAAENVYMNLAFMADASEAESLRLEVRRMVQAVQRDARACRRVAASGKRRRPERPTAERTG
jgi:methenyltetrahydrofolate cyclohydrolase